MSEETTPQPRGYNPEGLYDPDGTYYSPFPIFGDRSRYYDSGEDRTEGPRNPSRLEKIACGIFTFLHGPHGEGSALATIIEEEHGVIVTGEHEIDWTNPEELDLDGEDEDEIDWARPNDQNLDGEDGELYSALSGLFTRMMPVGMEDDDLAFLDPPEF